MTDVDLSMGPRQGVDYPLTVLYCGNCTMPIEYCEYYPEYEKCKQWLERNLPTEFEKVKFGEFILPFVNYDDRFDDFVNSVFV